MKFSYALHSWPLGILKENLTFLWNRIGTNKCIVIQQCMLDPTALLKGHSIVQNQFSLYSLDRTTKETLERKK